MEMRHRLAGVGAVVHDEAVAVGKLKFFRDDAGDEEEVAEDGLVGVGGFADARDGFLRDDEQVDGCLRLDVVEDDAEGVLVLDRGGDFAVDDFLENGLGHERKLNHRGAEVTEESTREPFENANLR